MKIKVTIQLDDEKFSASTTGPGDDEAAIGRAVVSCFAAIGDGRRTPAAEGGGVDDYASPYELWTPG